MTRPLGGGDEYFLSLSPSLVTYTSSCNKKKRDLEINSLGIFSPDIAQSSFKVLISVYTLIGQKQESPTFLMLAGTGHCETWNLHLSCWASFSVLVWQWMSSL